MLVSSRPQGWDGGVMGNLSAEVGRHPLFKRLRLSYAGEKLRDAWVEGANASAGLLTGPV